MPTQWPTVWRLLPLAVLAILGLGCGEEASRDYKSTAESAPAESPVAPSGSLAFATRTAEAAAPGQTSTPAKSALAGRKIIYHGQVDLVTEDLNGFENKLTALVEAQHGYIADSSINGTKGTTRRGTWKVRIPAEGYAPFVKAAAALGELVQLKTDSQDVSAEFYDIEARQAAKKVEEERLLKHLEETAGKLEDILSVERELSRVRSEIEQMQGRLRMLANLSSLATVDISASEIQNYVPPQAPTLGTRIARTFAGSVENLSRFGEAILLFIVALAPWMPFALLGLLILFWSIRRASRRHPAPTNR
jgi:hypothetical protein